MHLHGGAGRVPHAGLEDEQPRHATLCPSWLHTPVADACAFMLHRPRAVRTLLFREEHDRAEALSVFAAVRKALHEQPMPSKHGPEHENTRPHSASGLTLLCTAAGVTTSRNRRPVRNAYGEPQCHHECLLMVLKLKQQTRAPCQTPSHQH